jgi:hypothetical protein
MNASPQEYIQTQLADFKQLAPPAWIAVGQFGTPPRLLLSYSPDNPITDDGYFRLLARAEGVRFPIAKEDSGLEQIFAGLVKQWKEATAHSSFISRNVAHPAFLQILGMGKPALPMIMEALPQSPRRWLLPLRLIARTNPVREGASMHEAVAAWREWWRDNQASIL